MDDKWDNVSMPQKRLVLCLMFMMLATKPTFTQLRK